MKKEKALRFSLLLTIVLVMTLLTNAIPANATKGPREDDLGVFYFGNAGAAWTALTTGAIDLMTGMGRSSALELYDGDGFVDGPTFLAAAANPNIVLAPVAAANTYELDLNNDFSIPAFPGIRSPMNYTEMRQAIAFLTDKPTIVAADCGGLAERIDQMVAAPFRGWANEGMWFPFYPYEYNRMAAKALLDSTFPEGTTPNPNFVPQPWAAPFIRTYPADHPTNAGLDLDPLLSCERTEDARWTAAIGRIVGNMRAAGIPVTSIPGNKWQMNGRVMGDRNYHLYTGSWTVDRFPPVTIYKLYHSTNSFPFGANYVAGSDTHPLLDTLLEDGNYASSYSAAVTACRRALDYMTEICVNVPIWSDVSFCAYSNQLLGVVNMHGWGPINPFTFMNAYKADGTPIRIGLISEPNTMNNVYDGWIYNYLCLDRMNLYGGVEFPPYNIAADQPGFVTDWETTTWDDGGETNTKVVMSLRDDGFFARPVTGDQGENVNASHYFWNAWLDYQVGDGWFSPNFVDLHHIDMTDTYDFEIYFDTLSYWNPYYCQGPLRPMDTWMGVGPGFINQAVEQFVDPATPGEISLSNDPIWIDYVTMGGTPLTMFTDYNIVLGKLQIYTAQGAGTLEVSYRHIATTNALRGPTPGSIAWQVIFEGAGMYYATAFTAGPGGSLTLRRNPFYYMVTPLLGEIDFVKKSNGNYKIDIFDLVLAGGAFGSQGTGVPDLNWFPGADIAPNAGVVDIYDLVTITGTNWDQEFDPTEP